MMTIIVVGIIGILLFFVLIRNRIRIIKFLRTVVSRKWNNWIFLTLCCITVTMFFVASWNGGGEPLGSKALREAIERKEKNPEISYFKELTQHAEIGIYKNKKSEEENLSRPSWKWWITFLIFFITTICFCPFAFWDEITDAWHRVRETYELRNARIVLVEPVLTTSATTTTPGTTALPQTHNAGWGKFLNKLKTSFPGKMAGELAEAMLVAIFMNLFKRRS